MRICVPFNAQQLHTNMQEVKLLSNENSYFLLLFVNLLKRIYNTSRGQGYVSTPRKTLKIDGTIFGVCWFFFLLLLILDKIVFETVYKIDYLRLYSHTLVTLHAVCVLSYITKYISISYTKSFVSATI